MIFKCAKSSIRKSIFLKGFEQLGMWYQNYNSKVIVVFFNEIKIIPQILRKLFRCQNIETDNIDLTIDIINKNALNA